MDKKTIDWKPLTKSKQDVEYEKEIERLRFKCIFGFFPPKKIKTKER